APPGRQVPPVGRGRAAALRARSSAREDRGLGHRWRPDGGPHRLVTTVHFPKLHAMQREIRAHPARYKVIAAGRRWGKTRLGLLMCLETALAGGRTWWVGLTYKSLRPAWRDLSRIARQIGGARIQESDLLVTFPNGGEVMARTAEDPANLRGEGLDGGVIDEAAHLKQDVWDGSIRPSLMDRAGWGDPDLEPRRHELVPRP